MDCRGLETGRVQAVFELDTPMVVQESLTYRTKGRGSIELTEDVARIVSRCGVRQGLCHVFVHHTSASLMLCENADPTVLRDLEAFMASTLKPASHRWLAPPGNRRPRAAYVEAPAGHTALCGGVAYLF